MNVKENRAKWVAALRSGEYKQGVDKLCNPLNCSYCCLGVLCDVYEKDTGKKLPRLESGGFDAYKENLKALPQVQEWVELNHREGKFNNSLTDTPSSVLTILNDMYSEWDFNKLADLIESEPEGLFNN